MKLTMVRVVSCACLLALVAPIGASAASQGDSGGSVFSAGKAYGITSGSTWNIPSFCECNLVYVPIDYVVSGINVSILTQ